MGSLTPGQQVVSPHLRQALPIVSVLLGYTFEMPLFQTPLKLNILRRAHNLVNNYPVIQSTTCFLLTPVSSLHSLLNHKYIKETAKLSFSRDFKILLPSIFVKVAQINSKILYRFGHFLYPHYPFLHTYCSVCIIIYYIIHMRTV